uniref:Uncharacterized protein n=1 Tax=Oryza brachyantha TaxID=4533 RepID=J3MYW8_ORYBR
PLSACVSGPILIQAEIFQKSSVVVLVVQEGGTKYFAGTSLTINHRMATAPFNFVYLCVFIAGDGT